MSKFPLGRRPKARGSTEHRNENESLQGRQENLSASVNLDDIIENFDGTSSKSESSSRFSLATLKRLSQSHLSVSFGYDRGTTGRDDDETTSFYSALQDGFSLSEYYSAPVSGQPDGIELSWALEDLSEIESMLPRTNFEIFWQDLIYKIKPPIKASDVLRNIEQSLTSRLESVVDRVGFNRRNSYDIEGKCAEYADRKPITIIQSINGSFRSGELTAVLGPSGAGKTSLLNFLSRRRDEGYTGRLFAKNVGRKVKISTIPQNDTLPEYLTVRENLLFASRIKNLKPKFNHELSVERVAAILGLDVCLNTKTKKISGGQQKRLAIAQELLSKPDILILDEPTSGLDSLTCLNTLIVLKNLVRESITKLASPIAIIVTIHQPQEEAFELFDRVYVMANGGRAIYDGSPSDCTKFIEQHTNIRLPDAHYNPATLLIEIASSEFGEEPIRVLEEQVRKNFINRELDKTVNLNLNAKNMTIFGESSSDQDNKLSKLTVDPHSKLALNIDRRIAKGCSGDQSHFWLKSSLLARRCWLSILRDPKQLVARLVFHIMVPIGLSLMMGPEPGATNACPQFRDKYTLTELVNSNELTDASIQESMLLSLENLGFIYILIYSLTAASIGVVTLSFTLDFQRSLKEYYNGWYSMGSYLLARLVTEIPATVILSTMTIVIGYSLSNQVIDYGLPNIHRSLITAAALIIGTLTSQILGMIFGAIYVGHLTTALFASQGATLPFILLSGFVVRTKNMSSLLYILSFTSYLRHILEIAVIARYGFNLCNCDPEKVTGKDVELSGVDDRLKHFMKFWATSSGSESMLVNDTQDTQDSDMFELMAQQISLYNTFGVKIRSCADVVPYQLHEVSLSEENLPQSFLALIASTLVMLALLYLTVKLVVKFRTSL